MVLMLVLLNAVYLNSINNLFNTKLWLEVRLYSVSPLVNFFK